MSQSIPPVVSSPDPPVVLPIHPAVPSASSVVPPAPSAMPPTPPVTPPTPSGRKIVLVHRPAARTLRPLRKRNKPIDPKPYNIDKEKVGVLRELAPKIADSPKHGGNAIAAVSFRYFSKLPAELQLMVWKASLPATRIVELFESSRQMDNTQPRRYGVPKMSPRYKVPKISHRPLFHLRQACLDSFRLVNKTYRSYLLLDLRRHDMDKDSITLLDKNLDISMILLDNSVDVVMFFGVSHTFSHFSGYPYKSDFLASLQTMAIPIPVDSRTSNRTRAFIHRFIHRLTSLRKIIFITSIVDTRFREQELSFLDVAEPAKPNVNSLRSFKSEWETHFEESDAKDRLSKIELKFVERDRKVLPR